METNNQAHDDIEVDRARHLVHLHRLVPELPELPCRSGAVKIYALGCFTVLIEDRELETRGKAQKKPLELLRALLALGVRGGAQSEVIDWLWPDLEGDAARNALNLALHRLRKHLTVPDIVRLHDGWLSLDPRRVWVDAWTFEHGCARMDRSETQIVAGRGLETAARQMLNLYAGHFLVGEQAHWALVARERLRSKFLRGISAEGRRLERRGEWEESSTHYRRGIELDPLAEEFHRGLILSLREQDRVAESIDAYHRCRDLLRSSLGVEPSAATRALYHTLRPTDSRHFSPHLKVIGKMGDATLAASRAMPSVSTALSALTKNHPAASHSAGPIGIAPLLQETTGLIRGYGDIFAVSFRGRLEPVLRFTIDPRLGVFFWDTKVTANAGPVSFRKTHEGGGVTAGVGAAYRVWRGLEVGIGADYFRGSPKNDAALYSGSLEWRFGKAD